jgi:hypothetical protein
MKVTKNYISFQVTPTFEYDILKSDFLNNPLHWLRHLEEKNWFTKEILKDLLTLTK